MELTETARLLTTLISVIGTFTVTLHYLNQSRKIRVELLKELDEALAQKSKHRVCEIFRLIYGLRMSYSNILRLLDDDKVNILTYVLYRTPGMVTFSDGAFQYSGLFKKTWWHKIDTFVNKTWGLSSILIIVLSCVGMIFFPGVYFAPFFITSIFFTLLFALSLRQTRYTEMVDDLVTESSLEQ
ncbi:hypothetical protein [Desulfotalea psychrophila]|nr:hypothetical protein [Desulfotalea psychrophila]